MSSRTELERVRPRVRRLLDPRSPADALASYYALFHAPERSDLFIYPDDSPSASQPAVPLLGFLVRARTGMDLFRPLVTFRAQTDEAARLLLERGMAPGRPAYLTVPDHLAPWANKYLTVTDAELHRVYRLNPQRYQPILNVLAVTSTSQDGLPRVEIRAGERAGAVAGINWQSPDFAEVYVYTDPAVRGRGWGKSVVAALAGLIQQAGRTPLYVVGESNEYSIRLAEAVGFDDTGHREYVGQAVRPLAPA
jgi:ribosomal protein S18 acetylase RimI-like enzyme